MKIGGFQKQSLIDYPGKVCSIIFTQGCNFRCKFCHNPELVLPELITNAQSFDENEILDYLNKNKMLLDAVTITGGEPTIHKDLPDFISKIKELGLLVKLDSNGTNPEMLKQLIDNDLIDFIAMDVKAPIKINRYKELAGQHLDESHLNNIQKSIKLIIDSEIKHDFRTTILKEHHSKEDIIKIAQEIKGAKRYSLQKFTPFKVLDESYLNKEAYSDSEMEEFANILKEQTDFESVNCR